MNHKLKILLIEDDPDDALLIQDMLAEVTSTGLTAITFHLEWAKRLSDGLERLAAGGIDVILLDLLLSAKKGLDAFAEVHAQAPQVPIIVLSGLADEMLAIETLRQGAQDYLLKGKVDGHLLARATRYAIERQRTEEKLRQRNHQLALLHRASQTFSSTLDLDQVLNTVLEEVRHLLEVTATSIWLTDPETSELVCRQITGPHTEDLRGWRLSPGEGIVGWVADNNKSLIVPDTRADRRHFKNVDQQTGVEVRSILCVPLRARKDVVGVLELVDTETNRFKTTDLTMVEPLAATAAIAIENARLYQETDRLRAFNENIVQSMDEGILIYDPAGQITFVNPRIAELTGYASKELIGRQWQILIAPEHLAQVEQEAAQRPRGIAGRYETVIVARGGQRIPVILSARPLFDKERFTGVLVVCTDITERVQAEEALRESEKNYRLVSENIPVVVYSALPDKHSTSLFLSGRAEELTGYSNQQFMQDPELWANIVYPEDLAYTWEKIEEHREKKIPLDVEYRIITRDNTIKWIKDKATPMLDENGQIVRIDGFMEDVTQRVQAEEALRQSEQRYRSIFEGVQDAILVENLSGEILDVNSRACEILGWSREELLTKTVADLVPDDGLHLRKIVKQGRDLPTQPIESFNVRANGERFPVEVTGRLQKIGDETLLLVVVRDITERVQAEQALRESEARYRSLTDDVLDSSAVGVFILDSDFKVVWVNQALERFFGLRREEIVGRDKRKLIHTHVKTIFEDPRAFAETVLATYADNSYVEQFECHVLPQGERQERWLEHHSQPIRSGLYAGGRIEHYYDVTERKQAEQALRHAEWEKELILDSQFELVVHQDKEQRVLWPNRAACESVGATREELIGRFCYEIWAECGEPCADCPISLAVETGQPHETEKSTPDGRTWFVRGHPVRDVNDNIVGAIEVAREITERKQTEQERARLLAQIQQQAQQMQQIMDTVPEGVLLLDADLRLLLANPIARQALAALGEIDPDPDKPLTHLGPRPLTDVLSHFDDPLPMEIVLPAPSGRAFEVQAQPIGDGERRQWVLTLREVTQEREMQQQIQAQERLATVGQLAAGIAHDFNNIMASIVLYAGMLLRASDLSPQDRQRLDTIRQQGHRAANLVQQILDFARKSVMERTPLDLVPFLKELEKLLTRTLPENIHFHLEYNHDDYIINADPTRLQQVVMNLALNARDAMPQGGKLHFALHRLYLQPGQTGPLLDMPPGPWVRLTVTDTGTGIPPDALPHVFEPFFTTKEVGKGTGLGLAQVWGIVLQHEGKINVESEMGRGTTFTIYLPALEFPQETHETLEMPNLIEGQGETIMVVEDDDATRRAISVILEDLGYRVLAAANGREALAVLSSEVKLVLSDIVMPEMGGVALHSALKEKHAEVKMVVITGYPMSDGGQTLLEQGITAWVKKPFSIDEIAQVVREALE